MAGNGNTPDPYEGLTTDQLEQLQTLILSGGGNDLDTAIQVFKERNGVTDPKNAPGPPTSHYRVAKPGETGAPPAAITPLPTALDPREPNQNRILSNIFGVGGILGPKKPLFDTYDDRAKFFDKSFAPGGTAREEIDADKRATLGGLATAGTLATGGPWYAALLNGATTNSPADLATTVAGHGLFKLTEPIQAGGKILNSAIGAGKGLLTHETLDRFHRMLNGDAQAPLNPFQRDPTQLGWQAASGALGGLAGYAQAPRTVNPTELAAQKFTDWEQKAKALKTAQTKLQEEDLKAAQIAHDDAKTALTRHEKMMRANDMFARGKAQRDFRAGQRDLETAEKALGFQVSDQKKKVQDTLKAVNDHLETLNAGNKQAGVENAENLADKINELKRKMDGIRNPETDHQFLPPSEEEQKLQDTIVEQSKRLTSGKYNAGAKTQQMDLLEKSMHELEDMRENRRRLELDKTKDEIRRLTTMQRRANQGRFENVPTDSELADMKRLMELQNQHKEAQDTLGNLTKQHQQAILDRLTHAKNAPGATGPDVGTVQTHQDLMKQVEDTLDNLRKKQGEIGQIKIARDAHAQAKPTQPQEPSDIMKVFKKWGPKMAAGLGGAEFGGLTHVVPPVVGGLTSGALSILMDTPAGKKLLDFFEKHAGPKAGRAIPGLVNASQK